MKKIFLSFSFSILFFATLAGQKTVTGVVVDEIGIPLPGASVVEVGTTNGISTDFDGNYTIDVGETSDIFDHSSRSQSFGTTFSETPALIVKMSRRDGGDTSNVRITSITNSSFTAYIDEENSTSTEQTHTTEALYYLALLSPSNTSSGTFGFTIADDTTAPSAPTSLSPAITNDTTPDITGTAEAGSTVKLYKNESTSESITKIGDDIEGEHDNRLPTSISISDDGSIVAFGSGRNYNNGQYAGTVLIYRRNNNTWEAIGQIDGDARHDVAGESISLSAD